MENEITEQWKDKLDEYIKKCIKDNSGTYGIIFIGNTLNIKHMKIKVMIPDTNPMHKFFLKVNLKQNIYFYLEFLIQILQRNKFGQTQVIL
jgi:hypothetical protein